MYRGSFIDACSFILHTLFRTCIRSFQAPLARIAYARFAVAEYQALLKRWEEMQEVLSRMGRQEVGGNGAGRFGAYGRRQLTLSMGMIISDDSQGEDGEDARGEEW